MKRREFLRKGSCLTLGAGSALLCESKAAFARRSQPRVRRTAVSIVRIRDGNTPAAVEEAIVLLGGVETVAQGRRRVMLKPNLLAEDPRSTTKPDVVQTLARLFLESGRSVSIAEGSAVAAGFNLTAEGEVTWTRKAALLEPMQRQVFEQLGFVRLGRELGVPLVNLHCGDMVKVPVPGGLCYEELELHRNVVETDLLCSVPMMKTHSLAGVTLGMKNLVGVYPGQVYGSVRSQVHDHALMRGSPGVAFETLDMVRAAKPGLVVIDGSSAMEGNGPTEGTLLAMNVIVAGTNPLATDMVAARLMGFEPHEVPTFVWAHRIGMTPTRVEDVEIRGASIEATARRFARPLIYSWNDIRGAFGARQI